MAQHREYQYFNVGHVYVTDVTSLNCNVYSENEATRFTIARTLGMSLLTTAVADMVNDIFIAPEPQLEEGYEDKTDDTRTSKGCTFDE